MIDVFKDAMTLQQEQEKNRDFLEDFLLDKKEMDEQNKEVGNLLNEIAAGDVEEQEEVDRMFKEFENEAFDDQLDALNDIPLQNVTGQRTFDQNTNQNYNQQQQKQDDDINMLLSQAA